MFAKHSWTTGLAVALSLSLAGCLSSGEEDGAGGSGSFSFEAEMKVLDIVEPTGTAAGMIETRSYDYGCEGDEVVKDSSDELQSYVVTGGHLYMWDEAEEECTALKLSGSSSTIIGKWSTTSFTADGEIPEAYRPSVCDSVSIDEEDEELDAFDSLFQDINISYDVSQTKVKASFSGKLCMGKLIGASMATGGSSNPLQLKSSDCASATIENTLNDKTLKISTDFSNEMVKVTYTSSGKSCSYSEAMDLSSEAPTCPEPDYSAQEEAFEECLGTLAFFQDMEGDMAKRSAGSRASDLVKKVRAATPGL
jgi:hypothetical protein